MSDTKTISYLVEGKQKYPNNLKPQKKKATNIDGILQSQTKDGVLSLRPAKLQYGLMHFMIDARNLIFPNMRSLK